MALFDNRSAREADELSGSDAATRALSVTVVENDFVEAVYAKIAAVYDFTFGPTLHPGRLQAIQRMAIKPGDRVLEVGVGTGINLPLYPKEATVTGIDFSAEMLEKARERIDAQGRAQRPAAADGRADLKFDDGSFDIVYAPYVISVVPDPVKVAQRDVPGLPPRRARHHPQPFPQPEPARLAGRALDVAGDHPHRLQVGSRPAGVPRPGRPPPGVDREGQHPADLVARHLRQGRAELSRDPARVPTASRPPSSRHRPAPRPAADAPEARRPRRASVRPAGPPGR